MSIVQALAKWWQETNLNTPATWVIGYSGGQDSQVLLHAAYEFAQFFPITLRAVHVHHGLQANADEWVKHCEKTCAVLNIPLSIIKLSLSCPAGESVENIARQARYRAFENELASSEWLLTAHHLEDQAETVLLQLLRGSGPKGLAAMPKNKPFYQGWHARPLLSVSKAMIEEYAKQKELDWVEDGSNHDLRYSRNFVRHRVFKELVQLNPSYAECFARTAKHCADQNALLESFLNEDLAQCEQATKGLSIAQLKEFSPLRQQAIVRLWLQKYGYPLPSTKKLNEILQQMTQARLDAKPCVEWGKWQVERIKGEICVAARVVWTI